jgi:integrase/recombinase XerD
MKSLALSNPAFRYLEESFKEWLDILGYAPSTVYYAPLHVRELLHSLEGKGIKDIKQLDSKHIKQHYEKLKERGNKRRGGGLSNNHLNKHIDAIRKFTDYLNQVGRLELTTSPLRREEGSQRLVVLSEEEVQQLFKVTHTRYDTELRAPQNKIEAMRSRDRAMLTVYYGCGLRRTEGESLDVGDIDFDKALLHVRKGKNYKERFVPISKASLKHLQDYVYDHRPELLLNSKSEALFISQRGDRMTGAGLLLRLNVLIRGTENAELMGKEIGLHTLRHSIATHLLKAGMKLESIARFLGHSSLESTQIYTHLAGVEMKQEQKYSNIPRYEKVQLHEDEL